MERLGERFVRLDADELLAERLLERRHFRGLVDRLEQRLEDWLRCGRRRQHPLPVQGADPREARLCERRHVGVILEALFGQHSDRTQFTGLDHRR